MKLALVHDYFREWGGAEEVVATWHEIWPKAAIFTSYYKASVFDFQKQPEQGKLALRRDDEDSEEKLGDISLSTSWMQLLPDGLKTNLVTPLLPYAFGQFKFSEYDVVLSSSAAFAKTITVKKPTIHISYCHTPPRFLYELQRERGESALLDIIEKPFDLWLKAIDQAAAANVDYFIAPSRVVADRIERVYKRESTVIYPPVDINKFVTVDSGRARMTVKGDYFVIIGRLSPVKHFELAVQACKKLEIPLKVIGTGTEEGHLRALAGPTIEFLGRLDNGRAARVIEGSKAVINTVLDEDFGMVPIEVLAAGKPVIAYASDAAIETLEDGVTGKFFHEPTVNSLMRVLEDFNETAYNPQKLRQYAMMYAKDKFVDDMKAFIEKAL